MHKLRLGSTLYDAKGGVIGQKDELFERVIGDGAGKPLERPESVFTEGREVLKDNRIGPKETRVVVHRFPLKGVAPVSAAVSLVFERPVLDTPSGIKLVEMPITRVNVPAKADSTSLRYLLVGLVVAALAAAVLALKKRG
jgi:hypothetical protein